MARSPALSFKGWNIKEWLKGNWSTIKEVIKVGAPLILGWVTTHDPTLTGLITIIGKFVLDCLHYYAFETVYTAA